MIKKINSEIKFKNSNFKIKIGTTNKKKPSTIYINVGTYITPLNKKKKYTDTISKFEKQLKKKITNIITNNDLFGNKFIFVSEIAEDRMSVNKKSYFDLQTYYSVENNVLIKNNNNFKEISETVKEKYIPLLLNKITETINENELSISQNKLFIKKINNKCKNSS